MALAGGGSPAVAAFFIMIDLAFFGANMLKIAHGGWFPLLVSASILFLMLTWRKGRRVLRSRLERDLHSARRFSSRPEKPKYQARAGTAVYMSGNRFGTPLALASQSQTQQSAARASRLAHRQNRGGSVSCQPKRSRRAGKSWMKDSGVHRSISVSWRSPMCLPRWIA